MRPAILLGALLVLAVTTVVAGTGRLSYRDQSLVVEGQMRTVSVPKAYALEVLVSGLARPRLLAFADDGDLFVGSRAGKIYRLRPPYTGAEIFAETGGYPHSVAFRSGEVLIALTDGVYGAPYQPGRGPLSPDELTLLAPLPGGGGHSSRTVGVGPDGRIYASLGLSGNCSDQYLGADYAFGDRRGGVLVLREDAARVRWEPYAAGLRNPVGFSWHPRTGVLYASNNGPDHWGYELPPEYFSRLAPGSFHGMPWYQYDGRAVQPDGCIRRRPPRPRSEVTAPVATFPARNAPMGVAFVPKDAMDPAFTGDAIVALHGSWATRPSGGIFGDRSTRRPPKVVVVRFAEGEARRVDDMITGFQAQDGRRWARPVGIAIGPDGALYFSSDEGANAVFRLGRDRPNAP